MEFRAEAGFGGMSELLIFRYSLQDIKLATYSFEN